jgi:hypothetical protein
MPLENGIGFSQFEFNLLLFEPFQSRATPTVDASAFARIPPMMLASLAIAVIALALKVINKKSFFLSCSKNFE